jgi:membrane protein implicated in regulation of membrane protease activity
MNKIKLYWDIISPSLGIMLIGVVVFFIVGIALSIPLCLVWNWVMPTIFDLPTINVLQAFGLSILVTLLSPRKIDLNKKEDAQNVSDGDLNDKLEKVLKDITSEFKA